MPTLPPDKPIVGNIKLDEGLVIPVIESVQYASGSLSARIRLSDSPITEPLELRNENNVKISLNLYVSSPSGGSYFSNTYRSLVCATGNCRFVSIPEGKISISGSATLQANANYRCTLVIMDAFGQQLPVATHDFTVPPNP